MYGYIFTRITKIFSIISIAVSYLHVAPTISILKLLIPSKYFLKGCGSNCTVVDTKHLITLSLKKNFYAAINQWMVSRYQESHPMDLLKIHTQLFFVVVTDSK